MKAIMISDHAKWCALMMNGKKKVEVRKGTEEWHIWKSRQ